VVGPYRCFKCLEELKDDDMVMFSEEWDALCHVDCCPARNPRAEVWRECELCEIYRRARRRSGAT